MLTTLPQVDWSQRYDACHKMLARLSALGVQQFIDSITFSESAVDNVPEENRIEIVNRALRFARQQDAALKKKGITETQEERFTDCLCFDKLLSISNIVDKKVKKNPASFCYPCFVLKLDNFRSTVKKLPGEDPWFGYYP